MLELVLRFQKPFNVLLFAAVLALNCAWAWWRFKKKAKVNVAPLVAANVILLLAGICLYEVNHDDTGYLHFSWLISQGMVPFRDFWEHHSPFLPVLMAPFLKYVPNNSDILVIDRVFSVILFIPSFFLGWAIARRLWGKAARFSVYCVLITSVFLPANYFILRPDLFMTFLLLAMIYVCLDVAEGRLLPAFCAGVAFALAESFITKQYFLVFLPVAAVYLGPRTGRPLRLGAYFLGLCIGAVPLAAYLVSRGITADFAYWTIGFNKRILLVSVYFPFILLAAGAWGTLCLFRRWRKGTGDRAAGIMVWAFGLSTLSSLTTTSNLDGLYYLGFWYFVCAIVASGSGLLTVFAAFRRRGARALAAGLCFAFLLMPQLLLIWKYSGGDFLRDKNAAAELLRLSKGDTCVILLPAHPIFVNDATSLYSGWQFLFADSFRSVRWEARKGGICRRILAARPAVVTARRGTQDFILELYQRKLMPAGDYKQLVAFLVKNYTIRKIGQDYYYVRNDKEK